MHTGLVYVGKCVARAFRAIGHAVVLHYETVGYIMAEGELPADENTGLRNPVTDEYNRTHS
jgi:hypothetical protein